MPFLAGISLVMVLMAFLTTSDRPSVLRKAAFWATGTTAVYLIVGYGVPALLRLAIGDQAEIFAALITALLRSTLVPSIVLAGVGAALLLASWLWPDERPQPTQPRPRHRPQLRFRPPTSHRSAPGECATPAAGHPAVDTGRARHTTVQPRRPGRRRPPTDPFAPPVDIPLTSGPDSGMVPTIEPPPFRPTLPTRARRTNG